MDWRRRLLYPGLRAGERLSRETNMPPRATIEARDGTPLAEGEARLSELGALAAEIAGRVGPAPPERVEELERQGVPAGAPVGLTGLEREFDAQLAGTPGGTLFAGRRRVAVVVAAAGQRRADDDRSRPPARGGRGAGRAASAASPSCGRATGRCWPSRGSPTRRRSRRARRSRSSRWPPRWRPASRRPSSRYPVETAALLEGVELENANGEACGGTLRRRSPTRATPSSRRWAPGSAPDRLVAAAERFGFNRDPGLVAAARSTLPAADAIGDDLAVGSTAIGQGAVLATPLLMAGDRGGDRRGRHVARSRRSARARSRAGARATSARVARTVRRFMRAVVTSGTGVAAAIPGVAVAGKTGTAELRDTTNDDPVPEEPGAPPPPPDPTDTDAWFTAFAPARDPEVAVAVMLVGQGAGGETAAPVARMVLEAALAAGLKRSDVDVDDARRCSPPSLEMRNSIGRLKSDWTFTLKRIRSPWIGPSAAGELSRGTITPGPTGARLVLEHVDASRSRTIGW